MQENIELKHYLAGILLTVFTILYFESKFTSQVQQIEF